MILVYLALIAFVAVWLWAMWIALTQGDDPIARFGRKVLRRN